MNWIANVAIVEGDRLAPIATVWYNTLNFAITFSMFNENIF